MEAPDVQPPAPLAKDEDLVREPRFRWMALLGGLLVLFYFAWLTGFTFRFHEDQSFPNYNMLARAYAKGQLYLDESPTEDYLLYQNRSTCTLARFPYCGTPR